MDILGHSTLRDVTFSHRKTGYGILVIVTIFVEPDRHCHFDIEEFNNLSEDVIESFLTGAHADIEQKIRTYALPLREAWSKEYRVKATHEQRFSLMLV